MSSIIISIPGQSDFVVSGDNLRLDFNSPEMAQEKRHDGFRPPVTFAVPQKAEVDAADPVVLRPVHGEVSSVAPVADEQASAADGLPVALATPNLPERAAHQIIKSGQQHKSKADAILAVRPNCKRPGEVTCGGYGKNHCVECKRSTATGEAA
ncbi:hypothetical protein [Limoniibacter endophyticus]|uniref:Uncharacterized protein n=1 Tax=Limoniibacter endophyticus TaxID=1565040 RepID=A0A8J3GI73_9HYPH|nr:hypothetical protein [Limoniibacter endophyticus]GHC79560.1 hypothetical protein GCM10010136_32220 [Limoniibacter endophyticus]